MMTQETALGAALKSAVQTMSKKKQTDMIAEHVYNKYDVLKRFKPLALGIDQDLIAALPQFDATLIARVLANHCRRPRYLKALARGGKRFDLNNRFKGEITAEEQAIAQQHPSVVQTLEKKTAKEESTTVIASTQETVGNTQLAVEHVEETVVEPIQAAVEPAQETMLSTEEQVLLESSEQPMPAAE